MRKSPRLDPVLFLAPMVALAVALAGCARGPDYVRPDLGDTLPASYHAANVSAAETTTDIFLGTWWTAFGDTVLTDLVNESLVRNHDLAQAAARVLESRALLTGSRSAQWPAIEIGGSFNRSKFTLAQFGGRGSVHNTLYSAIASARYELDLWGRLSRAEEAALADLLAREADRRTVQQTVVADVVRTWLEAKELECQLALNQRTIANYESNLQLVEERYQHGLVPPVEVHLARQNLLSARALQPQWKQNLATARRRLEILAGRYPAAAAGRPDTGQPCDCALPPELPPVPAGLPATMLERRPDILAAELRLRAATAHIGEARAALFPRISLTGEAGYRTRELADLFKADASIWSLIGNLTAPLLNRGAQQAQVRAAEARTEQAVAAYRGTVLNALREVEVSLETERHQSERRLWLLGAVDQARRALNLAEDRYRRGLDNLLLTLDTQRRLYQTEAELIRTEHLTRAARVNLILALGGPWAGGPATTITSDQQGVVR